MEAPEVSLNSSMFDFSLHLSPETSMLQNVIHNTSNVEQCDQNQSIFLEIGIVESEIHNQQPSPNEDENNQTNQCLDTWAVHSDRFGVWICFGICLRVAVAAPSGEEFRDLVQPIPPHAGT